MQEFVHCHRNISNLNWWLACLYCSNYWAEAVFKPLKQKNKRTKTQTETPVCCIFFISDLTTCWQSKFLCGMGFLEQLEIDKEFQSCIWQRVFLAIMNFKGFQKLKNYYICQQYVVFINCLSSGKWICHSVRNCLLWEVWLD